MRGNTVKVNMKSDDRILDRYLTPADAWAMAFGCVVGWGAFVMPGTTFLPLAGPAGTLISMALGALIMLAIGSNFAFLMNRRPGTGGAYTYAKEAFGRDHAFLCSWFLCLSYLTIVFLNSSAIFVVVRTMFGSGLQDGLYIALGNSGINLGEEAISAAALIVIGLFFVLATPKLQKIHTVLAIILLAGILLTTAVCLPYAIKSGSLGDFGDLGLDKTYSIFNIVILAPWAFVGFEVISFDTAHFRFPVSKSKRVIFLAIILGAVAYGAMSVVSIAAVPAGYSTWADYTADLGNLSGVESVPSIFAATARMGKLGSTIILITALAAIFTGIIGGYRATMRVLSTMAEDRILSERFEKTSYSILFIMVLSVLLSLLGRNTLIWFVDLTSFGAIVGFGYTSAAALKIARAEGLKRQKFTGLAGLIISAAFGLVQLVPRLTAVEAMGSEAFLLLSLWCLLGFVFYHRTIKKSSAEAYGGLFTSGVVLFFLLLYSVIMWFAKTMMKRDSLEGAKAFLKSGGVVLMVIIFVGFAIMIYIQDLVRRKNEEAEREKISALESSKAKSRFLFNMSHDIRTPMNAIIGYTQLALKEPASDTLKNYLGKIEMSSQHLLALINDILEMSRIENGKIELEYAPADLCGIFGAIGDLFSEQMKEKGIDFSTNSSGVSHRYVYCDSKNLNRILLNLIGNAYKFTPKGGTITASVLETGSSENEASYEIRVRDTGIGMSREFSEKMFTAFERERTSTVSGIQGTGLGLAITKSIIDLMHGDIEVNTAPGKGTEMIIRLDLKTATEEEYRKETGTGEPAQAGSVDFSKCRLLLVEDNELNLDIAEVVLTQAGFKVETARNGKEALDIVASSEPGYFDAVLMDIQMPVMGGYEATRAIRALDNKELASIPILAMTANAFKEDEEAALAAGMQAHIAKPIDVNVMMTKLAGVLEKRGQRA